MATLQKLPAAGGREDGVEQFPAGLRVLVVDDDTTCLRILERMLRKCLYQVTTCCRATIALSLLRERKGGFDLVISDVYMPDMDGFKLLELVGLEMDLPVIMMSADGRTSAVMRGIKHGACDYLIKPVRMEELKNIWQHVVRKKWSGNKEHENSGSVEDTDRQKRGIDDVEYASSVNDGADSSWKPQKKKRDAKEDDDDDGELDNDDPSASKKPRVVWSVELHQQFVSAVNQLGIDKAVPKRILELMNVPGLTRENVASHLQKFRLYLKRLSGVTQHQTGLYNPYSGPPETNTKVNPLGRVDFQALAASGQIPPLTLAAALHAEFLGRPSGSMVLPVMDQPAVLQTSIPGSKYVPVEHGPVGFGQSLVNCHSNITKQFPQNSIILEDVSSGFSDWPPNNFSTACSTSNLSGLNNIQNCNVLGQMLPQKQSQPVFSDSSHAVNVQPSCLIAPSVSSNIYQVGSNPGSGNPNSLLVPAQPSNPYHVGNNPITINQSSSYGSCNTIADYSIVSSQPSNASLCVGQASNGQLRNAGLLNGFSVTGSITSFQSGLASIDANNGWRVSNSVANTPTSSRLSASNLCDIQGSGGNAILLPDQLQAKNHGFVGKDTCIPSRFAADDIDSPVGNPSQKKMTIGDDAGRVKQEIQLDFLDGSKGGNIGLPHFPSSDYMSVISK